MMQSNVLITCIVSYVLFNLIQHGFNSVLFNGLYKYSLIGKWLWSLCGGGSFERTIGVFNVQFHFGEIEVFFFKGGSL